MTGTTAIRLPTALRVGAEAARRHVVIVLVCVVSVPLAAVAQQSSSASYVGRVDVVFADVPPWLRAAVGDPAVDLKSRPVLDQLFDRTSTLDDRVARGQLADRLTVLQRAGARSARLLARARTEPAALGLADQWAATLVSARALKIQHVIADLRRALLANARDQRSPRGRSYDQQIRSLADLRAAQVVPPDAQVASSAVSVGYHDLVPWPAPLAGLALGLTMAYVRSRRASRLTPARA